VDQQLRRARYTQELRMGREGRLRNTGNYVGAGCIHKISGVLIIWLCITPSQLSHKSYKNYNKGFRHSSGMGVYKQHWMWLVYYLFPSYMYSRFLKSKIWQSLFVWNWSFYAFLSLKSLSVS
jgi:hypothetical protein